ncbi:MAG: AAA family ATPase [Lachnospiraceae bacterium]|nr:AAA family ATPase [Lachnospiraceae bacterium]
MHIDFSIQPDFCESYKDYIGYMIEGLKEDLAEAYPHLKGKKYAQLSQMFKDTEATFVFILDEWDSLFYEKFMSVDDKNSFLKWLKILLKDRSYVELAYMTGVLPIAKYSSGSELNMFGEYNFMNDNVFDQYFGFSEEEVKQLCQTHTSVPYEKLKRWYDGYYLSDGRSLFNPRSVNNALTRGKCLNYWTETGPMHEIAECIEHNVDEVREDIVKMVSGVPVEVVLDGYSAAEHRMDSRDEILSAMVVYGFLAYYNHILTIPNAELMEKFQRVLSRESMAGVKEIVDQSKGMLEATLAMDEGLRRFWKKFMTERFLF